MVPKVEVGWKIHPPVSQPGDVMSYDSLKEVKRVEGVLDEER